MGLFSKKKNVIDEAERKRLWDGLAEFLRLNFRPEGANTMGAAPVSADACKVASLEAQESALRKASSAMSGTRIDEKPAFLGNSMMPTTPPPGFPVAASTVMMISAAETAGAAAYAGGWDMEEAEKAEELAEAQEDVAEADIEAPAGAPELDEEAVEDAKHSVPVSAETLEYRERKPLFGSFRKKSARRADACHDAELLMDAAVMDEEAMAPSLKESAVTPKAKKRSLGDVVKEVSETWQQSLLRKIDERGCTDAEVYKRAGLDRKLFSKIRCNENYQPKKPTAVALALALRLSLDETRDMLARAGFALSPSSRFDLIVEYFIDNEIYDVDTINIALYEYGQQLLGA